MAKGVLHIGAADTRVYTLDAATGRVLRAVPLRGQPVGRPTLTREGLFVVLKNPTDPRALLAALDPEGKPSSGIASTHAPSPPKNRIPGATPS